MSYCDPEWVSDYRYRGLAERLALVNGAARLVGGETARVRMEIGSGRPRGPRAVELDPPQGEQVRVRYLDARMSALDEGEAVELELDHASSPIWMVPEGPRGTALV